MIDPPSPSEPGAVFVFTHPNHELAVYGMIQRLNPRILYLTDGGGPHRVEQTKAGLDRIGRRENALFLDHTEESFYRGLVDCDADFFSRVAGEIRDWLSDEEVEAVHMDAIEFYNPVHDLAVPLVFRALVDRPEIPRREIPLVHQVPDDGRENANAYLIQRFPRGLAARSRVQELDEGELRAKLAARDEVYSLLADQFGTALSDLSDDYLSREFTGEAPTSGFREPGEDFALRYDRRARILRDEGKFQDMITFEGNYRPLAESLLRS